MPRVVSDCLTRGKKPPVPNRMLKFIELGSHRPDKRGATARRQDFDEIYQEFDAEQAAAQAGFSRTALVSKWSYIIVK